MTTAGDTEEGEGGEPTPRGEHREEEEEDGRKTITGKSVSKGQPTAKA